MLVFRGVLIHHWVSIIRQRGLAKVDAEDSHPFPREAPIIIKMHMFIIHYLTAYFFLFHQSKLVIRVNEAVFGGFFKVSDLSLKFGVMDVKN